MVKVEPICAVCLMNRALEEVELSTGDRGLQMRALAEVARLIGERFGPGAVPAWLGAERDRIVRRLTGCPDPYREAKRRSNEEALRILPRAREVVAGAPSLEERFRRACMVAAAGNAFEFGVMGYSFSVEEASKLIMEATLAIDDSPAIYGLLCSRGGEVLYLLDNAGEVAFDLVLIEVLKELGVAVRVVAKGSPILNDALLEDALFFGLDRVADEVLTTGSDEVGFMPDRAPPRLRRLYEDASLVIAKGMGNYETLTEYPARPPVAHLLKAKCGPIARSLGVPIGSLVVKLRSEGG